MKFELPQLPFEMSALEPHISGQTIELHYSKHHQGYLDKLEAEIGGTAMADLTLEKIIRSSRDRIFDNAAQVWNHSFYWNSMSPHGGGKPGSAMSQMLDRDIGGLENFKREFAEIAGSQFGSGWAWLVADRDGQLRVLSTPNAQTPLADGYYPLLTLDVWEHAYYLDFKNERDAYIAAYLEHLINWQFAESNLEQVGASESTVAVA